MAPVRKHWLLFYTEILKS